MPLTLTSPAFSASGTIPSKYTCDGDETSPPLEWSGVPDKAMSLALVVDDPDAPDPAAPKRRFVHWVLYNIPPDARGLSEAASGGKLPPGAREGANDFHHRADTADRARRSDATATSSRCTRWTRPCPASTRHREAISRPR